MGDADRTIQNATHQPSYQSKPSPLSNPEETFSSLQDLQFTTSRSPQEIIYLQRTIGNRALNRLLVDDHKENADNPISGLTISDTSEHPQLHRLYDAEIQAGGITNLTGRTAKSLSRGKGAKKPLAIVEGKLNTGTETKDVEVHVHLNATDPLSGFSGANVRDKGTSSGFYYISGGEVDSVVWLKNILDGGIRDWKRKSTWTPIDADNEITWQGLAAAGSLFDQAERRRKRTYSGPYHLKFDIKKKGSVDEAKANLKLLVGPRATIEAKSIGTRVEFTITYPNEQVAYEQLDEDEAKIAQRWSGANFVADAKTTEWK